MKLYLSFISALVLLCSCSEDTVVDTGSPSGTVLFSLDSISIWLDPGTMGGGAGRVIQQSIEPCNVRVEYKIQTNVDSLHSVAWLSDSSYVSSSHVIKQYFFRAADSLITYSFYFPSVHIYFNLDVSLIIHSSTIPHYIRIRDFRVTKL